MQQFCLMKYSPREKCASLLERILFEKPPSTVYWSKTQSTMLIVNHRSILLLYRNLNIFLNGFILRNSIWNIYGWRTRIQSNNNTFRNYFPSKLLVLSSLLHFKDHLNTYTLIHSLYNKFINNKKSESFCCVLLI